MYEISIHPSLKSSVESAIKQYNALVAATPGALLKPGYEMQTTLVSELWDQIPRSALPAKELEVDFDKPLAKSQMLSLIRALEMAVFLGDGRYCSVIGYLNSVIDHHPNAYELRQAFLSAEQALLESGVQTDVDPRFRQLASSLRDAFRQPSAVYGDIDASGLQGLRVQRLVATQELDCSR